MNSEETPTPTETQPYAQHSLNIGMKVVEEQSWFVVNTTPKSVKIKMRSERDLGYKVGKALTFRWDGTGYIRQKQYLRPDGIY